MKKASVFLSAFIIFGYVTFWGVSAYQLKNSTIHQIAELNQSDFFDIHYDDIRVAGFPFRIGVELGGAKVTYSTSKLLNVVQLINLDSFSAEDQKTLASEKSTITFAKPIRITSNLLVSDFILNITDYRATMSDVSGSRSMNVKAKNGMYSVALNRSLLMKLLKQQAINDITLQDFKSLTYAADQTNASEVNTKKPLAHYGPVKIGLDRQYVNDYLDDYHIFLDLNVIGVDKISETWHELKSMQLLTRNLSRKHSKPMMQFTGMMRLDANIKMMPITQVIKASMIGPLGKDFMHRLVKQHAWSLAINDLEFKNTYCHAQFSCDTPLMNTQKPEDYFKFALKLKVFDPAIDPLTGWVETLLNQGFQIEVSDAELRAVMPKLVQMGQINLGANFTRKGNLYTIKDYHFGCDQYRASFSGVVSRQDKVDATLKIQGYRPLISDALNYAKKLNRFSDQYYLSPISVSFPAGFDSQVQAFLLQLSNDPLSSDPDIELHLVNEGTSETIRIGQHNFGEVMFSAIELANKVKVENKNPTPKLSRLFSRPLDKEIEGATNFRKGLNYQFGHQGVTQDYVKAIEYYQIAAKDGDPKAMNNLSVMIAQGKGTQKDLQAAEQYFKRAAALGDRKAWMNLQSLKQQKGIPALVVYSGPYSHLVLCEKYNKQSVDNLMSTSLKLGWTRMSFIPEGQPNAIPKSLRRYAHQSAKRKGITIVE